MERREFVKSTAVKSAAMISAASYSRVLGANERVHLGIIGAGGQGRTVWKAALSQPDVVPAAVCDVYRPNLEMAVEMARVPVATFTDFRKLLEQKDVDAVIVATPDHWHALAAIRACEAGKDVYVEKPLALTIREGRLMVNAARKHGRIVQTGTQQRSRSHYVRAVEIIRSGQLGAVSHVSAGSVRNSMPGFAKAGAERPLGLDWNMWLGPAPYRESLPLSPLYHFRWFWHYSGGQMTNFGAHDLDIARWAMGVQAPTAVAGLGGRYALNDGGETPDVQEVIYRFPNFVLTWSTREMNGRKGGTFLEFHGSKGNLTLSRTGFEISAEFWPNSKDPRQPQIEEASHSDSEPDHIVSHVRNFLDCVKSRQRPNADVEDGHLTAVMCHLGNIATRTGRLLRWDPTKEEIIGDAESNKWLHYEYRKPWNLV